MTTSHEATGKGQIAIIVATAATTLALGVTVAALGGYLAPRDGPPAAGVPTDARPPAAPTPQPGAPPVVLVPIVPEPPVQAAPPGPEPVFAAFHKVRGEREAHERHDHEERDDDD